MDEMALAETKKAELRRDKRLKKEFKKRQKDKKAREEMRMSKQHQMTSAPEGMEMDDVGAHDLAVEAGIVDPDGPLDAASANDPDEAGSRATSASGAGMAIQELESAEEVRASMIKDVTSHTYDVDEHEFMAAHLDTISQQQAANQLAAGNATEVTALKDRLMSGPNAIPPAATSMEIRPMANEDNNKPAPVEGGFDDLFAQKVDEPEPEPDAEISLIQTNSGYAQQRALQCRSTNVQTI